MREMLRLMGIPIPKTEALRLITALALDGGEHALAAAATIRKGLDDDLAAVALPREQRDAILVVLAKPPSERLAELAAVLRRDHEQRRAS